MEETPKTEVPKEWNERIAAFATAIGKSVEDVTNLFKKLVGEPSQQALELLADKNSVPDADIKEVLKDSSVPSGILNKSLTLLRGKPATAGSTGVAGKRYSILPELPDDKSILDSLKIGGISIVDPTDVVAAVRTAIAQKEKFFELPDKIYDGMEAYAKTQDVAVGKAYYEIQELLTQKKYGDVLSLMGVKGRFMSDKKKNDFLARLDENLWKAVGDFHLGLMEWQKSWFEGVNPATMLAFSSMAATGAQMPEGMVGPPDTSPLISKGEEFVNKMNKIFAGTGIPVGRALAYEVIRIKEILDNPDLPLQFGVTTKEQMLKAIGAGVGPEEIRLEKGLPHYVLSIMTIPKIAAGEEVAYFSAMIQLGQGIPWNKIGVKVSANGTPAGIGNL